MTTDSITIPQSLRFAREWRDAHWSARVLNPATGKIELFVVAHDDHGLLTCALRLTTDDVALLRKLPAFDVANAARDAAQANNGAEPSTYDCRCNGERIEEISELALNVGSVASNAMDNIGILYRQVDEMRTRLEELEELVRGQQSEAHRDTQSNA
jgi:hypothetical protein